MKYLILCLFLVGCVEERGHHYIESSVDVQTLPECDSRITEATKGFVNFKGDDGSVLFISQTGSFQCLHRKKCKP